MYVLMPKYFTDVCCSCCQQNFRKMPVQPLSVPRHAICRRQKQRAMLETLTGMFPREFLLTSLEELVKPQYHIIKWFLCTICTRSVPIGSSLKAGCEFDGWQISFIISVMCTLKLLGYMKSFNFSTMTVNSRIDDAISSVVYASIKCKVHLIYIFGLLQVENSWKCNVITWKCAENDCRVRVTKQNTVWPEWLPDYSGAWWPQHVWYVRRTLLCTTGLGVLSPVKVN